MTVYESGEFTAGASVAVSKEQSGHLGKILNIIGTKIEGSGEFEITGVIVEEPVIHIELKTFTFKISFQIEKSLDVKEIIKSVAPESVADVISNIQKYVGLDISASIYFGGSFEVFYDFTTDTTELTVTVWFGTKLSVTIAIVTFSAGITIELSFNFAPIGNTFTATFIAYAQAEVDLVLTTLHFDGSFTLEWSAGPEDKEGTQMNIDIDNDGLSDDYEQMIGTDPTNPDTDGDGISDGIEISEYKTDPTNNDTDGDHISDGAERDWYETHGCEPLGDIDNDGIPNILDIDSDNDSLPDGDEILVYYSDPLVRDSDGDGIEDGEEVSIGTSPIDSDSDDDNMGDNEELAMGLNPTNNDTDGDGLRDGFEEYILGTNPDNNDTDGDSLSDGDEYNIYGTNPLVRDSDGDGLDDGYEVLNVNTSPLYEDSDNDNVTDYEEIKGWYISFTNDSSGTVFIIKVTSDPLDNDTDNDGVLDGVEKVYGSNPQNNDTDNDGLTDDQEISGVTYDGVHVVYPDPTEWDTDGDTLSDGYEVNVSHADPTDDDTDDDCLDDGTELSIGTNMNDNDTDNDGILDGPEYDYLNNTRNVDPATHDVDGDGTIDIKDNDSDNDGLLDDDELLTYFTDPLDSDTDDDGASDSTEINSMKTDPLNPDTDGDGLLDGTISNPNIVNGVGEGNVGTSPLDNDTDNDGLLDGEEIELLPNGFVQITNPLNPDSDNDGLLDGHEYEIFTDPNKSDTDDDGLLDGSEVNGVNITGSVPSYYTIGPFYPNPLDNDTDNDGLDDGTEVYTTRTDPTNPDFDGDGLTDGMEVNFYLTSPVDADTDHDNVTDYEEIFQWNWAVLRVPLNYFVQEPPGYPEPPMEDNIPHEERHNVVTRYIGYYFERFKFRITPFRGKYYTDPLDPDTDDDNLSDGEEKFHSTNPNNNDTDRDGLLDGDEVKVYHTDPRIPDCDFDGLLDGYEELTSHTEPLDNDTDDDGLTDYEELRIWNTDPLNNDTDNDNLTDSDEVYGSLAVIYNLSAGGFMLMRVFSDPLNNDTDNDGLGDGDEILKYHSNPFSKDTDGDELNDSAEVSFYSTNNTDFDTDKDGLLDGFEIQYGTDPLDPDEDDDEIPDGKKYDYDNDTISDYDEIYTYHTYIALVDSDTDGLPDPWEIAHRNTNPCVMDALEDPDNDNLTNLEELIYSANPDTNDTDNDGLSDYDEVFIYGTLPNSKDTDNDRMSDFFEVSNGLDPLVPDTTPPSITSITIPTNITEGDNVTITAIITDDSGVDRAVLYVNYGDSWIGIEMTKQDDNTFSATLYYVHNITYRVKVWATDYSGNTVETSEYTFTPTAKNVTQAAPSEEQPPTGLNIYHF